MDAERRQNYLADFKPKRAQDRGRSKEANSLSTSREQHARQAATWRELYLDMSRTRERTTLLERTLATLDARSIAAATDVELLRVPTDPTFIHIKGRLGKRLTAAMQQSTPAAAPPDPHQLDDSFFAQLKSPSPPPPPTPPPPPPTPPPDSEEEDREGDPDAAAPSLSLTTAPVDRIGNDDGSADDAVAAAAAEEATVAGEDDRSAVSDSGDEESAADADSETMAVAARSDREDDTPEEESDDDSDAGDRGDGSQQVEGAPSFAAAADSAGVAAESGGGGATRSTRTDSARSRRRTASVVSPPPAGDDEVHTSARASPAGGPRDTTQSVDAAETTGRAAPAERRRDARQKRVAAFLPRLSRFEPHAAAASEPSTSPPLPPIAGAAQRVHVSAPVLADKRHKGHRGGGRHATLPELLPAPKPWRPVLRCPLCMCRTTDVAHVYEAAKWLRHRLRTPARRSVSLYGLFART